MKAKEKNHANLYKRIGLLCVLLVFLMTMITEPSHWSSLKAVTRYLFWYAVIEILLGRNEFNPVDLSDKEVGDVPTALRRRCTFSYWSNFACINWNSLYFARFFFCPHYFLFNLSRIKFLVAD